MAARETAVEGMNFGRFMRVLWRRSWVIVACLVLVPAVALLYTSKQEKLYSAAAQVLLSDPGFEDSLAGNGASSATSASQSSDTQFATNVGVAQLDTIAARTARAVDHGRTAGDVAANVTVSPSGQSNILSVKATDPDPRLAARIANVYSAQYIAFRRAMARSQVRTARVRIDRQLRNVVAAHDRAGNRLAALRRQIRQGTTLAGLLTASQMRSLRQRTGNLSDESKALKDQGSSLRNRAADLGTLAALQTGDATLLQRADPPSSPTSPNRKQNLAAGIVVGLVLGIVLAVLLELVDRRVRHPKEVETIFDRPILGAIPHKRALGRDGVRLPALHKEPFRMLQANLHYAGGEQEVRSVLVTSAGEGDGKSTVAWNIGVAGADAGARVLLIEADLRHPSFAARCGWDLEGGLTDVLSGRCEVADVVRETSIGERAHRNNGFTSASATPTMDVLFAGRTPHNPGGLLASRRMSTLLGKAELEYDLVVMDTPPTPVVADAIPLIKQVTGVVVVTRLGKNTRDATAQLRDQLHNLNATILGVVVNSTDVQDTYYRVAPYVNAGTEA